MTDILTAAQVAARYGVSKSHVYALAASGVLPCLRLGACVRFSLAALTRWELAAAQVRPFAHLVAANSTPNGLRTFTSVFGPASRPGATKTKEGPATAFS